LILQTAPWTKMTADISALDKADIRDGLALEASLAYKADQATVESIPSTVLSAMNATPPAVNVKKINGYQIAGAGTEANPWGPS
jgi:hypothetical protein